MGPQATLRYDIQAVTWLAFLEHNRPRGRLDDLRAIGDVRQDVGRSFDEQAHRSEDCNFFITLQD